MEICINMSGLRFTVINILLVFSLTAVSCQIRVKGFTGDNVLLPCVNAEISPQTEKVSFFWRDKNDNHVFDIKQTKPDDSSQHHNFRGRVESFPNLYKKGNFSIILKNVKPSDSGSYECIVPEPENFQQEVHLTVSGAPAEKAATPPPAPSGRSAAGTLNFLHLPLLSVPLFLCLF